MYSDLGLVIDFIIKHYDCMCLEWIDKCNNTQMINLKKKTIKSVFENIDINDYIFTYSNFVVSYSVNIDTDSLELQKSKIHTRTKARNSIEGKLKLYNGPKHHNGNIPINKCMNDLLGFRIIIDDEFSFLDIKDFVESNYSNLSGYKLKCIDSSKNGYFAIHIYFSKEGSNYFFPWELQVWKKSDEVNNIFSHKKYKQDYTNWEQQTREE